MTGAAVVGEIAIIFSNAHSEGSDSPQGRVSNTEYKQNRLQYIKESYAVTSSADSEECDIEVDGKPFFTLKGAKDTELRLRSQVEHAMILSDLSDGTVLDENNNNRTIDTTKGVWATIRDEGFSQ